MCEYSLLSFGSRSLHACRALPCQLRGREGGIQTAPLGWGGGAWPAPVLSGPLPPLAAPLSLLASHSGWALGPPLGPRILVLPPA